MAKQKLTPEKRVALRKELKRKLAAGVSRSEILKTLSTKFGITPEGMRWYLKEKFPKRSKASTASTGKRGMARRGGQTLGKQGAKAKKATSAKPALNGSALHLPEVLNRLTERDLKRLLSAKKMVPDLEASRRREQELRTRVRELGRELRAESYKARKIQRQIKRLARV
jgi:hypothetical protein